MLQGHKLQLVHCMLLLSAAMPLSGQVTPSVNLSGIVTDSAGTPISGAAIKLEVGGLTTTSGADGRFTLTGGTAVLNANPHSNFAAMHDGSLFLSVPEKSLITITAFGAQGKALSSIQRSVDAGSHSLKLPEVGNGVRFFKVNSGATETLINAFSIGGASARSGLQKQAVGAAAYYDVLTATKTGFQKAYVSVANSDSSNIRIKMLKEGSAKFSFFVTSMKALTDMAGPKGFGGDFRYGETGAGAGLRGADKICATIAEKSMPGSSVKGWRAFLSVTADAYGKQVDAINRVGPGPWYDRIGRLLAPTKNDLLAVRPTNGDPTIQLDLPNENGIPNHKPDPTKPDDDNHHMVTGSATGGKLKSATATCKDWTTAVASTANGKPSCGFSWPRGGQVGSSGSNWMTTWDAPGCEAGIEITQGGGPPPGSVIIGGGGGYGGFYCFALNP